MVYPRSTFSIFDGDSLFQFLNANTKALQDRVEQEPEDYILNVNETLYRDHIAEAFRMQELTIDFDGVTVSNRDEDIPATRFPPIFNVRRGGLYRKPVITYHMSVVGNTQLLRKQPSSGLIWTTDVYVEDDDLCLDAVLLRACLDKHVRPLAGEA